MYWSPAKQELQEVWSSRLKLFYIIFLDYNVTIDENTPPGLTIFCLIHALDKDKPNTDNSVISYSILNGNEDKKFSLEGTKKAVIVLRKPLDYESRDTLLNLTILAEDYGIPKL